LTLAISIGGLAWGLQLHLANKVTVKKAQNKKEWSRPEPGCRTKGRRRRRRRRKRKRKWRRRR